MNLTINVSGGTIGTISVAESPLGELVADVGNGAVDGSTTTHLSALAFGDRLKYLRWLLGHTNELQAFGALYDKFEAATTLGEKMAAVMEALQLLNSIIGDFPTAAKSNGIEAFSESSIIAMAERRGINWERLGKIAAWLLANAPTLIQFLPK